VWSPHNFTLGAQRQPWLSRPILSQWTFKAEDIASLTPAVNNESIYLPLNQSVITSLRSWDGVLSWKAEVGGIISASPIADNQGVYVASESFPSSAGEQTQVTGVLRFLSRQSGVTLWVRELAFPVRGVLVLDRKTLFGVSSDGRLYAFEKETGHVLWVKTNDSPFTSNPLVYGDNLYLGDQGGNLLSVNVKTGETQWRYQTHGSLKASATVIGRTIIAGSTEGFIYAFDLSTGKLRWRVRTSGAVQSVLPGGRCVLATSLDTFVYCLSLKNGVKLWKYQLAGRVSDKPLVIEDGVVLSPIVGEECIILSLQNGKKRNSLYLGEGNYIVASPLLNDHLILFPTRKGLIAYASQSTQPGSHTGAEMQP
jgi:outer membrane protein assembly factor BamB